MQLSSLPTPSQMTLAHFVLRAGYERAEYYFGVSRGLRLSNKPYTADLAAEFNRKAIRSKTESLIAHDHELLVKP